MLINKKYLEYCINNHIDLAFLRKHLANTTIEISENMDLSDELSLLHSICYYLRVKNNIYIYITDCNDGYTFSYNTISYCYDCDVKYPYKKTAMFNAIQNIFNNL